MTLSILVLGSGGGGGSPQWNCACAVCGRVRKGGTETQLRTQSSLAVSGGAGNWFLLNASPDLRQQILANERLHPQHDGRHSPIAGVVLTNADVDHIGGLLTLRECQPLAIYATKRVHDVLDRSVIFNILDSDFVSRRQLTLDTSITLTGPAGEPSGIEIEPFAVPGKVALYLEDPRAPEFGSQPEDTIGLKITSRQSGASFFYIPGCASMPSQLAKRLTGAALVLFDGTLWQNDEMIANGFSTKTGARMGHMNNSGADGSIAALAPLGIRRKIFIHINNTNPILLADSPERAQAEAAGWEISYDGMEVAL